MRPFVDWIAMMTNESRLMKFSPFFSKLLMTLTFKYSYVIVISTCLDKMVFSTWMNVNVAVLSPTLTQTMIMVSIIKSKSNLRSTDIQTDFKLRFSFSIDGWRYFYLAMTFTWDQLSRSDQAMTVQDIWIWALQSRNRSLSFLNTKSITICTWRSWSTVWKGDMTGQH